MKFIAHVRKKDKSEQTLEQHLLEVMELAGDLSNKIDMKEAGQLLGLMHDFGKYSDQFQAYIKSAVGLLDPDIDEEYVDSKSLKGKIDHSSAGAQWIWQQLKNYGPKGQGELCGQILALCIASHHSGLIDCLKPIGENGFDDRMKKVDEKTHLEECKKNVDVAIIRLANNLANKTLVESMLKKIALLCADEQHTQKISNTIKAFYLGFWTRFLFSCLIDADRLNSADFENPRMSRIRRSNLNAWGIAIDRLENFLSKLEVKKDIDHIRRNISNDCKEKSNGKQGLYTLTVPTGGGKTLSSLRFALHHAQKNRLDRIIYVIPFTSIIEQNAEAIRNVVEYETDEHPWVLEHHSNLEPERQTWHSKLASENWDAPIVLTTMVQFLETLFGGGTKGVRRLHQLANSVIIFDEIQTLPVKCTHLFCNALNFLTTHTKTTAVLCTATQPLLDKLKCPEKGQLSVPKENEIMTDTGKLFESLKRINIVDKIRQDGWSEDEIAQLGLKECKNKGSCLIIVNTKEWSQKLFLNCKANISSDALFHLSTNQCSAHRKILFDKIKSRLKDKLPVLCVSTQLIEAGVDIDFASVVRFLAGLDSIAQAAGRCNRNALLSGAIVHVLNPDHENIDMLPDIKIGKDVAERILREDDNDGDLLSPSKMHQYFDYYFYQRAKDMIYPVSGGRAERTDNLLNMLSINELNPIEAVSGKYPLLRQSFMTVGKIFEAIDAPNHSVIVPFGDGKNIIVELCAISKEFDAEKYFSLLRKAQRYTVNVFPNVWKKLKEIQAVNEIQEGEGIFYLDERFYSDDFGLSTETVGNSSTMIC